MDFTNKEEWNAEVARLHTFFDNQTLPTEPLQLNKASKIENLQRAISTLFLRAEENPGKPIFKATIIELQEIEAKLKENDAK